jgi:hypothetical protein
VFAAFALLAVGCGQTTSVTEEPAATEAEAPAEAPAETAPPPPETGEYAPSPDLTAPPGPTPIPPDAQNAPPAADGTPPLTTTVERDERGPPAPNGHGPGPLSTEAPTAPADGLVFCEEVGRRVTQAQCDDYRALAQSAQRGLAAFNAPDPMMRGEVHVLQLAVSFTPETEDTPTPAETVEPLPGDTVEFQPLVGRFMRAELTGVGFEITAQSPASQEIALDGVTTWNWRVVARDGGERALTLTTVVEGCTGDGQCVPLRSTAQNYTVTVEVSLLGKVRDFLFGLPDWIKIISAILAALAGLIAAGFGLRNAVRKGRSEA